jgi:hypothetical protein
VICWSFLEELTDDGENKRKFREYIQRDGWQIEHFDQWMKEALSGSLGREFQDLVVAFGKKLGFKVEFGSYGS